MAVVVEAYKRLNIPIKIIELPGKRALVETSEGRYDGEVHRIFDIGEYFPSLIRVPTPISYIEPTFFARKNLYLGLKCSDLDGKTVGIVRGVKHGEICAHNYQKTEVANTNALMLLLEHERVEIVITDRISGLLELKRLDFHAISALSPPLERKLTYHYLHEKHAALVPLINNILIEMEKNGELANIRQGVIDKLLAN